MPLILGAVLVLTYALTRKPLNPRARCLCTSTMPQERNDWQLAQRSSGCRYPAWPSQSEGRRNLSFVLQSFAEIAVMVPVEAAEHDSQWEAWLDGGFEAHKFIHKSISRESYAAVLSCLQSVLARCREAYPDLWAVLKFVPKKNGLNPTLALLAKEGAAAVSVADLRPRALQPSPNANPDPDHVHNSPTQTPTPTPALTLALTGTPTLTPTLNPTKVCCAVALTTFSAALSRAGR